MAKDGGVDKARVAVHFALMRVAINYDALLPQPAEPKKRTCAAQICIENHEFGGTDKSINGHHYDSIPLGKGVINAGMACHLIRYGVVPYARRSADEEHGEP